MTITPTILSFLLLLASATPAAYCARAPSCGSTHPEWTLDPINLSSYYTYQSPSASGAKLGTISFTFKNDQVDRVTTCQGSSTQPLGQFYSLQTFDCEMADGADWTKTSFSYDTESKTIAVNSTWTCPGGDVVYSTSGSGVANLDCTTDTWKNPDWQPGEVYSNTSTTCQPGSLVIQL